MADLLLRLPPPLDDACALFLDVDGTLVDFADTPEAARLPPDVHEVIARLSQRLNGALALVSGRSLEQLDQLFAPLQLPAAGLHGHQLRGDAAAHAPAAGNMTAKNMSTALDALRQRAAELKQQHPGILIEDKYMSLALHWRRQPEAAAAVLALANAQIAAMPGYRLQAGNHVIEFVPEGSDKGMAVEHLMRQPAFAGRQPVFVGDDLTDEFGFAAADRLGGWGVLVGMRAATRARYALPCTRAVHDWLHANAASKPMAGTVPLPTSC